MDELNYSDEISVKASSVLKKYGEEKYKYGYMEAESLLSTGSSSRLHSSSGSVVNKNNLAEAERNWNNEYQIYVRTAGKAEMQLLRADFEKEVFETVKTIVSEKFTKYDNVSVSSLGDILF
jgi:hypothetical protein